MCPTAHITDCCKTGMPDHGAQGPERQYHPVSHPVPWYQSSRAVRASSMATKAPGLPVRRNMSIAKGAQHEEGHELRETLVESGS